MVVSVNLIGLICAFVLVFLCGVAVSVTYDYVVNKSEYINQIKRLQGFLFDTKFKEYCSMARIYDPSVYDYEKYIALKKTYKSLREELADLRIKIEGQLR